MDSSQCENITDSPTAHDYFKEIDTPTFVLTIIALVCAGITTILWILQRLAVAKYISRDTRKDEVVWLIGIFPLAALGSAVCACIPRSVQAVNVFILLYFARSMFTFWSLVRDLFNGKVRMSQTLMSKGIKVNLRSPPCGCCLCCLHPVDATVKNLNKVRILATQVAMVRPTILFISVVQLTNTRGKGIPTMETVFGLINTVSTMLSMYGLMMLTALAREPLKEYRVKISFHIMQIIIVTYSLQGAIFNILADNHVISCSNILPAKIKAEVWNHLLLTAEALLLSVVTSITLGPTKNALFDKHPAHTAAKMEETESRELL